MDCPWDFSDQLTMSDVARGAKANYSTMTLDDIKALDIKSLADPDGCVLALWVPSSLLQEGLDTMKAYGFNQKQTYIWVKTKKNPLENVGKLITSIKDVPTKENFKVFKNIIKDIVFRADVSQVLSMFLGRLFRQSHEICLIGTNNNKIYKKLKNKSQRSVSFGQNLKHSEKPEHLQDSLDVMFGDVPKLEIFARRSRPGWRCIGNECLDSLGIDVRDSIEEIKKEIDNG